MQEIAKLKPCPFCGGEAKIYNHNDACHVAEVALHTVQRTWHNGADYSCKYLLKAIQGWNNREITPDVIDKISQELQDAGFEEASKWIDCNYEI